MKRWMDIWKQCSLIICMLLIQLLCFWSFGIENEAISYCLVMQLFLFFCYLIFVLYKKKKRLHELRVCDAAKLLEIPAQTAEEDELWRILKEAREDLLTEKLRYRKDKQERETYFQIWIHQIKTPIFAMRMLSEHVSDEKRKKQLRSELFKIERYTQMALNVQRMDDDYLMEKCHLHDLVREALRTYSTLFIEKGLHLDFTYDDDIVYTDRKWLIFVIEQVLDNAVKYTEKGTIHIHCREHSVIIQDEGCGIAEEDLALIMRKGYTGKLGREERQATGMGLYFVKEICRRLHAQITISSTLKKGTTVTILPVSEHLYDKMTYM